MSGRYYPKKDLDTIEKFNRELLGEPNIENDGIIDQFVIFYKVSVYETETNMYGEASDGKVYQQPVKLPCTVAAEPSAWDNSEFGLDKRKNVTFAFQRAYLHQVSVKPDIGDIMKWNDGYFEIGDYSENQLIGGQTENNHSLIVSAHLVRTPTHNLEEYRGF